MCFYSSGRRQIGRRSALSVEQSVETSATFLPWRCENRVEETCLCDTEACLCGLPSFLMETMLSAVSVLFPVKFTAHSN